jgi:chromosome segregation ATPase
MLKYPGRTALGAAMASGETDRLTLDAGVEAAIEAAIEAATSDAPEAKNTGPEAEIVDRAGSAILGLVSRAADAAAADLREAREVAERLVLQLQASRDQVRAAEDQINALKADVRLYRDRANRAEKWLQQISSEIEQKFLAADHRRPVLRGAPQQNEAKTTAPRDPRFSGIGEITKSKSNRR